MDFRLLGVPAAGRQDGLGPLPPPAAASQAWLVASVWTVSGSVSPGRLLDGTLTCTAGWVLERPGRRVKTQTARGPASGGLRTCVFDLDPGLRTPHLGEHRRSEGRVRETGHRERVDKLVGLAQMSQPSPSGAWAQSVSWAGDAPGSLPREGTCLGVLASLAEEGEGGARSVRPVAEEGHLLRPVLSLPPPPRPPLLREGGRRGRRG